MNWVISQVSQRNLTIYQGVQRTNSPLLTNHQGWGGWRGFLSGDLKPITKQKNFNFSGRGIELEDVSNRGDCERINVLKTPRGFVNVLLGILH